MTIIEVRRRDRGYSQTELAEIIRTTQAVISNWENLRSSPSPRLRDRLSQFLGGLPDDYNKNNPRYIVGE